MSDWRPIATAPKEVRVFVTNGQDIEVATQVQPYKVRFVEAPEAPGLFRKVCVYEDWGWNTDLDGLTHWLPLDALPPLPDD